MLDVEVKGRFYPDADLLLNELKKLGLHEAYEMLHKYVREVLPTEDVTVVGYLLSEGRVYVVYADYFMDKTRIWAVSLEEVV
jgi:hypothetical protein